MDDKDLKIIYKICDTKSLNEIHKEFNQYNKHTLKKLKSDFTKFKINEKENLSYLKNNLNMISNGDFDKYFNFNNKGTTKKLLKVFDLTNTKIKQQSYSAYEITFIKENYSKLGMKECAKILNVSETRIRQMAYSLGLKRDKQFSKEEKEDIKKMCELGYTAAEIADKHKRSIKSIYNYIYNNNLTLNESKTLSNKFIPSAPELYMINKMSELLNIQFPDKTKKCNRNYYWNVVGKYEIDLPIYINNLKFAIEYDGVYWHDSQKDSKKDKILKEAGFIVFRISDKDHKQNLKTLDAILIEISKNIMDLVKRFELTGSPLELNTLN